jgi:hypothetical protein
MPEKAQQIQPADLTPAKSDRVFGPYAIAEAAREVNARGVTTKD